MFLDILETAEPFDGKDGKTYYLSPLRLSDLANFVQWVKYKPYHDAKASGAFSEEELKVIRDDCRKGKVKEKVDEEEYEEFDINIDSTVVREAMVSVEGIIHLLTISLQIVHPGLSISDIADDETIKRITDTLLKKSGLIDDSEKN